MMGSKVTVGTAYHTHGEMSSERKEKARGVLRVDVRAT